MGKISFGESIEVNQELSPVSNSSIVYVDKYIEVPIEVIKEVPVEIIREVEVIREVPVEIIKEVEVIKEIEIPIIKVHEILTEDTAKIRELKSSVKNLDLEIENIRLYNIKLKAELKKENLHKWLAIIMIGVALCL